MALQKTVTTPYGIEVIDAYHRIECVQIVNKTSIVYHVRTYKDNTGLPFFNEVVLESYYDINGDNPIAQAYAHLKTLPEYADAVDC